MFNSGVKWLVKWVIKMWHAQLRWNYSLVNRLINETDNGFDEEAEGNMGKEAQDEMSEIFLTKT